MLSNNQIDKLGHDLRSGQINVEHLKRLELFRSEFAEAYNFVEELLVHKMKLRITGRPSKSTVAIVEKLKRETVRLSQIQDIAGCRVLVQDLGMQDSLLQTLELMLGQPDIDDKRELPTNGYRAVHVIVRHKGRPVEIQVRTAMQHAWAEISEKLADTFGQSIKYGSGDGRTIEFLASLSKLTAELEYLRHRKFTVMKGSGGYSARLAARGKLSRLEESCIKEIGRLFAKARVKVG